MRYLSRVFQPVITIPKNAKIKNTEITSKSQKLLLECGLIRPTSAGLFTILPLARRALDKLEALTVSCIESAGAQRISLPSLTSASLWEKTGRLKDVGPELLVTQDRHGKKYLLAPTHEEAIADLMADVGPLSYKQLPLLLYQITNKYRDELRPKHGLLRAREFSMLDLYGVHCGPQCAHQVYQQVSQQYQQLFRTLGLNVYQVPAPSGDMGGSLSHEWQLPAPSGEDSLVIEGEEATLGGEGGTSSIEVGHTFVLGTKYSSALSAAFTARDADTRPLVMSCYGIGLTRLLAASLEALSSEKSLRWPKAIAPYSTIIIGPKEGSKEWQVHGLDAIHKLYSEIVQVIGDDVLIDDRHALTIGKRLMMADRMGYPNIVVCGKSLQDTVPRYELYTSGATDSTVQMRTRSELLEILGAEGCNIQCTV